jgi:hypothetical protein
MSEAAHWDPVLWCRPTAGDALEDLSWLQTLQLARRESQPAPEAAIASARALAAEFQSIGLDYVRENAELQIADGVRLQCAEAGALLWLCSEAPNDALSRLVTLMSRWHSLPSLAHMQLVQEDSDGMPLLQTFSAQGLQEIDTRRAQRAARRQQYAKNRRLHVLLMLTVFFISVLISWRSAAQDPWRAFFVAVVYTPLLFAAVLTLLYVWQRLQKAWS